MYLNYNHDRIAVSTEVNIVVRKITAKLGGFHNYNV